MKINNSDISKGLKASNQLPLLYVILVVSTHFSSILAEIEPGSTVSATLETVSHCTYTHC